MPNGTQKKKKLVIVNVSPKQTLKVVDKTKKSSLEKLKEISLGTKEVDQSMSKSPSPKRYNEDFISILKEFAEIMKKKKEGYRQKAYTNAAIEIIKFPDDITDPTKQLAKLPGIGPTILNKLEEYVKYGSIAALEKERNKPANVLASIYNVGPAAAQKLIDSGITTIEQLRENQHLLSQTQTLPQL